MTPAPTVHHIRKYPNRRYYDTTTSAHMGMEDIYALVRAGDTIQVIDSHSGEDITSLVLTQIILDHEGRKLDVFPSALLHQVIQANQNMLGSFVERYFGQAFSAFVESKSRFDEFLRRAGMPGTGMVNPFNWAKHWMNGGGMPTPAAPEPAGESNTAPTPPPAESVERQGEIESLQTQLADISRRLEALQLNSDSARAAPRATTARPPKRGRRTK